MTQSFNRFSRMPSFWAKSSERQDETTSASFLGKQVSFGIAQSSEKQEADVVSLGLALEHVHPAIGKQALDGS